MQTTMQKSYQTTMFNGKHKNSNNLNLLLQNPLSQIQAPIEGNHSQDSSYGKNNESIQDIIRHIPTKQPSGAFVQTCIGLNRPPDSSKAHNALSN